MNLKELRGRFNIIASEMSGLAQKTERSDDEETKLDALLLEFNDLGPQVERLVGIEAASSRAKELGQSNGHVAHAEALADQSGEREKGLGGRAARRRRSPGQLFAESDAVKDWLEHGGKTSAKVKIGPSDERANTVYDGDGAVDRYALIDSGDLPGFMAPPMVVPDIKRPRDYALTARDVLINGRTTSDTIYFLRELLFTNAAAEVAEATSYDSTTLGTGGKKPESSLTFEEASAPVKTIAHWIPLTKQAIADTAQLQTYVENRLMVGLARRFNSQVWNGTGAGGTITGILATSGVQVLDAAAFTTNPVNNPATNIENFERVLRGATEVEMVGDAMPTFYAMNPYDLEKFMTVADDNKNYIGTGPFAFGGVPQLWGHPIARDRAIPQGTVVAGDGTMAAIWDREDAAIYIDTINDQFIRNMLTILAEMRAALTVFRPSAFAKITLAAW